MWQVAALATLCFAASYVPVAAPARCQNWSSRCTSDDYLTNDQDYDRYLAKELPGEHPIAAASASLEPLSPDDNNEDRPKALRLSITGSKPIPENDKGEKMLRDWIAEPYEASEPSTDSVNTIDFIGAYLRATLKADNSRFLQEVLYFIRETFGVGSVVWGIKHHHALRSNANFNPVELYIYNDHPKWQNASSAPAALLHALSRFYPDSARWITSFRRHTRLLWSKDAPCDTRCRPDLGKRFINHMTGIELPQHSGGRLDSLEFIEACNGQRSEPRCTWVNHVNVLHDTGKCRHKNTYYHTRQSIEEGWYRDDCTDTGKCMEYSSKQMLDKVYTTIRDYAVYHGWNTTTVLPKVLELVLASNNVKTRNAWTVAHKSKLKSSYRHPDRHAIYNYGLSAEDTANFAFAQGFEPKFVEWIRQSAPKMKHILFDTSVDFVLTDTGTGIEVVGAAIGGGSL